MVKFILGLDLWAMGNRHELKRFNRYALVLRNGG